MKKLLFALAVATACLALHSCDILAEIDLTDQASVDKLLPSRLEKHIDPNATVYKIRLMTTADFSVDMGIAVVDALAPGAEKAIQYTITIAGNQDPREREIVDMSEYDRELNDMVTRQRTHQNGIKLSEIDFSKIASNVAKACEIIQKEGYAMDGISSYDMEFDGNPTNTKHSFTILSKAGTNMGAKNGRAALVTEYYESHFTADAAGNVVYVE